MKKKELQYVNGVINQKYYNLKKELAIPTSVLESKLKTYAKRLEEKIFELEEDAVEVFKIQPKLPISAEHFREVEQRVGGLLKKMLIQKNQMGKNQKNIAHSAAMIEEVFMDFKRNVSILTLKNNLEVSGIDIERL